MIIAELLHEALSNLWRRKLRTLLAISGIVWGTYAVIMLFALGQGFYQYNQHKIISLAKPLVFIYLKPTSLPYQGQSIGTEITLSFSEIMRLPKALPEIASIVPYANTQATLSNNGHSALSVIETANPEYFNMYNIHATGRIFNPLDMQNNKLVIFLSYQDKQQLFPEQDPIGQPINLNGISFTVIGYNQEQYSFTGSSIPYTTYSKLFGDRASAFRLMLNSETNSDQFKQQLLNYLAKHLRFSAKDTGVMQYWDITKYAVAFNWILLAVRIFLGFCGVMTLIVGGISIANMLYLMVKERIREIGLKMALGAEPNLILLGFLIEALVLVFSGGLFAALLAAITLRILQAVSLPDWLGTPAVSLWDSLIITGFLLLTAILAGYSPARHAAKLTPVQALTARG
jgi:putative ABC transport system permease protein